jgi:thiamine-monophosphate kinase
VAEASGVRVDIQSSRLAPGPALLAAAAELPGSALTGSAGPGQRGPAALALEWVLTGGEDHSLVAAFPPGTELPGRWRVIGAARTGTGVTVDGAPHQGPGGWQHFR